MPTPLNNFNKKAKVVVPAANKTYYADEVNVDPNNGDATIIISGHGLIIRDGMDMQTYYDPTTGELQLPKFYTGSLVRIERSYGTGDKYEVDCAGSRGFCAFTWGGIAIT